jgi:hypothetical protein
MILRPLPGDLLDHLAELTGNEYKVWTYYYLRSDGNLQCHPSNQTIEEKTGLSERTVKGCKRHLIKKGWLGYTGDYKQPRRGNSNHSNTGEFAVPVMEVRLPWMPDWSAIVQNVSLTIGQKLPAGYGYGSGFGCVSPLTSVSDSHYEAAAPPCSTSKEKGKSKPENPEPTPEPTATPSRLMVNPKVRMAMDGTPWPEGFNVWLNKDRLEWLEAHGEEGRKQGRMVEKSSQKTVEPVVRDGKPKATPTALLNPPGSAAPPTPRRDPYADDPIRCRNGCSSRSYPVYRDKLCRSCYEDERRPSSIETTAPLDNWEEL